MPVRKHKPEEIIGKLHEVKIMPGQGGTTSRAGRRIAVSDADLSSLAQGIWWPEDGSGAANARLRRAISDLTLDKLIRQEAAKGNF